MAIKKEAIKEKIPSPQSNNISYVIAVVAMILIGVAGVAVITSIRPQDDVVIVGAMVFGFITPTTLSLLSFMKSQETHLVVNSRMSELLRVAEEAAEGRGRKAGRDEANTRTDELAQKRE